MKPAAARPRACSVVDVGDLQDLVPAEQPGPSRTHCVYPAIGPNISDHWKQGPSADWVLPVVMSVLVIFT